MFKEAGIFWGTVLAILGRDAITMPWGVVYILPSKFYNHRLRAHEQVHLRQIEREGAVKFMLQYFFFLLTLGYLKNPYEVEAYAEQAKHTNDGDCPEDDDGKIELQLAGSETVIVTDAKYATSGTITKE